LLWGHKNEVENQTTKKPNWEAVVKKK